VLSFFQKLPPRLVGIEACEPSTHDLPAIFTFMDPQCVVDRCALSSASLIGDWSVSTTWRMMLRASPLSHWRLGTGLLPMMARVPP
jgi:hypothetical protein